MLRQPGREQRQPAPCAQPSAREGDAGFGFFNARNPGGLACAVARGLSSGRSFAPAAFSHWAFNRSASRGNGDDREGTKSPQEPVGTEQRAMALRYEYGSAICSPLVDVKVGDHELPFVVDTGCMRTVVSLRQLAKIGMTNRVVMVAGKKVKSVLPLVAEINGVAVSILADALDVPWNLLGVDVMQPLGCLIDLDPVAPSMLIRNTENVRQHMRANLNFELCKIAGVEVRTLADTGTTGFLLCPTTVAASLPVTFYRGGEGQTIQTIDG